ncbi:hypothetical protein GOODEAATRI_030495 [Goodea atripinnis]|uniref:Uncharacterized protein n=1 Tax=Goodea atripinnis TaxID=208336 RepID=A0ABV0Q330_9TELE
MSVMTFHVDALRRLCGFNICILMRNCSFRSIATLEQLDTVALFSSRVNVVRVDGQVHINAYVLMYMYRGSMVHHRGAVRGAAAVLHLRAPVLWLLWFYTAQHFLSSN